MADIASTLSQVDIPIKLRCAVCNKLALDAFKLPCCDQSICTACQATTGDTCAVCTHSPLDASSCIPNKSLRLTVKAFIKSEEKKRIKEQKLSVPPTPTEPAPPEPLPVTIPITSIEPGIPTSKEDAVPTEKQVVDTTENPVEPVQDLTEQPEAVPDDAPDTDGANHVESTGAEIDGEQVDDQTHDNTEPPTGPSAPPNGPAALQSMPQNGFMPQLQGMGGFGGFPMMGMPYMGMMPGMMNGFGMGMGDMNMNMNMNMGMGGFPNNAGWNNNGMGHYGQNTQYNQFNNNHHRGGFHQPRHQRGGFQQHPVTQYQRGYGRGRGGYDRGGGFQHQQRNDVPGMNGDMRQKGSDQLTSEAEAQGQNQQQTGEDPMMDVQSAQTDAIDLVSGQQEHANDLDDTPSHPAVNGEQTLPHDVRAASPPLNAPTGPRELNAPTGPRDRREMNIPTGPKAMRAGLPNTGRSGRVAIPTAPRNMSGMTSASRPRDARSNSVSTTRSHGRRNSRREDDKRVSRTQSRRTSRSPSPSRHDRRGGRDGEQSDNEDDRSRRPDTRDSERRHSHKTRDRLRSTSRDTRRRDRSRSRSRTRKRSHSRHRDRDRDRDRSRDRHRERRRRRDRDRDRSHSASDRTRHRNDDHKSRHRRSEAVVGETEDIGFRIRGSKSGGLAVVDDDVDKNTKNGHVDADVDTAEPVFAPPSGPRKDRDRDERNGDRKRRDERRYADGGGGGGDPYALEREARHAERVAKENQRRESASHKRSRTAADADADDFGDDDDDVGTALGAGDGDDKKFAVDRIPTGPRADKEKESRGKKARRLNYKYEDEIEDDVRGSSRRASRVERERERERERR